MRIKDLKVGVCYTNIKHGTQERLIDWCKYRKEDGTWVDGVVYEGVDRYSGVLMRFATSIEDFVKRFKL